MASKEIIIDAAEIETRRGIYYLGPFARRVSFRSQQIRALNLIWALHKDERVRGNDRVAVIGAGIAGVTAACALRAYGCTVDVFDRGIEPMWRQRAATHRLIHPNINFWPAEQNLQPTTAHPFMEWYCDTCNNILDMLMTQWKEFVACGPELLKFHDRHEVRNVWEDHEQIFLDAQPAVRRSYKIAIVAAGFGEELTEPAFTTVDYWKGDILESERLDERIANFVVSGCGDGGMIDALRVAYDFGHGRLAVEVAGTLTGTLIAELLSKYDRSSATTTDEYIKLARTIDEDPRYAKTKMLLDSKLDSRPGLVIMVDSRLSNPFHSGAAPVHKLMVAYARNRGIIRYRQGTIARAADKSITSPFSSHDDQETRVIVRHGAHLGFGKLLNPEEVERYKEKQKLLGEYNFSPAYAEYPVPDPWPRYAPAENPFRSHRRPFAERAIRKFGRVSTVKVTLDGYEVLYSGDLVARPNQLFGVDVTYTPESEVPTEEALV